MSEIKEITSALEWEHLLDVLGGSISFFQSFTWGELEQDRGGQVFRFAFYSGARPVAAAQAVLVPAKRGKYLHVRNGPTFAQGISETELATVLNALKAKAKELRCDFLRISPLVENNPVEAGKYRKQGGVYSQMHDVDAEVTWLLNLKQDSEAILKDMRDSHRYLIRKALKMAEVEIEITTDPERLKDFWPIYEETFKRQGWTAYNFDYLKKEFEAFNKSGQIRLFLAKYQDKYIAGSLFIYYRGQVFYHHSGSLTKFRNIPATYKIHWESILLAQQLGFSEYNFFGIARDDSPNHPWAGLTQFKKGFGGHKREWLHALDFRINLKYWLTHYYEKLERKQRGYK